MIAAPPSTSDIAEVSNAVSQIAFLESQHDWDAVYDLVNPFSAQVVPRDALVGWYEENYGSKELLGTTIESVTFLDSWQYAPNFRPYLGNVAEVVTRQQFESFPDEYNVLHLAKYEALGWRWFVGDDKETVADMVNEYSSNYLWNLSLEAKLLDQTWNSKIGGVSVHYQSAWNVEEAALSDSIVRARFDAGYESFRTEYFSIETGIFSDCLKLYEDECIRRFASMITSNQSLMFDGFSDFQRKADYHAANHLFPTISLALDEQGQIWFIELFPIEVLEDGVVIRADLHIGSAYFDVTPVDAMYLWATIDNWSWRSDMH